MKASLVNGSPHKGGCTHTALQVVGDALRESGVGADEFWVGNKPIAGCWRLGVPLPSQKRLASAAILRAIAL